MKKVKVILIGNDRVGKSSLAYYLCHGHGNTAYNRTIGIDLCMKCMNIYGNKIQLHIFDSTGSKRYRHISEIYIRTAEVVLLVYSVTDRQSFVDLTSWIESINKINPKTLNKLVIIANKSDQGPFREISYDDGKKFAEEYNAAFFECSAIDGTNVDLAFRTAIEKIIDPDKINKYNPQEEFSIFHDSDSTDVSCWINFWETLKYIFTGA